MIAELLTEHHLEFMSFKGGCRGSSESTLVKMSNCWKSRALALLTSDDYRIQSAESLEAKGELGHTVVNSKYSYSHSVFYLPNY